MSEGSDIVCFHCGQSVGDPPRLNHTPDGEPCRSCADRLLEALPPIFHAPLQAPPIEEPFEEPAEGAFEESVVDARPRRSREPEPSDYEGDQPA